MRFGQIVRLSNGTSISSDRVTDRNGRSTYEVWRTGANGDTLGRVYRFSDPQNAYNAQRRMVENSLGRALGGAR